MKQAKTLSAAEIDKVLRYTSNMRYAQRNRAIVMTSFLAGLRVGEIAALRIGDVRNDDGTVKGEWRLTAEQTKGKEGRTVFVSSKLQAEIALYLTTLKGKADTQPLFYSEQGGGFSSNTLAQWFHWLYKRAGIAGASSHSGRRTFATNIAANGTSLKVLMRLMGHRQASTTAVYIDANDEMLRNAVELA